MTKKEFSTEIGGKKLTVEISDLADQANGSVLVKYGNTSVFATAVMSKNKREGLDYFPLTVDYEERFYAAGMILGSRFIRREGRPSDEAILTSRLIDRTIRPLFNKKMRNEVQVIVLALAVDGKNDSDIPSIIAGSLALGISDIPWDGPVGAVRIGYVDGKYVVNPTFEEREKSLLNIVVCGKDGKINMIEADGKEASEEIAEGAMETALKEIEKIQKFQEEIIAEVGREKVEVELEETPKELIEFFDKEILEELKKVVYSGIKGELNDLKSHWIKIAKEKFGDDIGILAGDLYEEKLDEIVHNGILEEEKRPDGRKLDEIRPLFVNVGVLPVVHGSGVFYRGGTHILSVVTLGGPKDAQIIEGMEVQTTKRFMHHYNFPPFSTGEIGKMGRLGRREIGHGALAEKALQAVIPDKEEFPYTIRVVSESMASNGSTSMGSVCASTLALMDAGVPIKRPVAGIAMGLMMKDENNYKVLTDIQGPEDHHGDMDFKVAGTEQGITAIQMDVKVKGVTVEILKKALDQARKARLEILAKMREVIAEPRKQLAPTAPRVLKTQIPVDKIGLVIGPGGRMINDIVEQTGVEINIEQDGTVYIVGRENADVEKAKEIIDNLTKEFEIGDLVEGEIIKLYDFGAIVKIGTFHEGMIHISELSPLRVNKVEDIVKVGDKVKAKIIGIDEKGRLSLSLKQADPNYDPSLDVRNNHNKNDNKNRKPHPRGNFRKKTKRF